MAPITMNGSLPDATASGSEASGDSWERSSSQAKKRRLKKLKNAGRCWVSRSPVVLKRNAHHGITGHIFLLTTRVQHRALRDRAWVAKQRLQNNDFERHLAADVRQGSEMEGEGEADHHCYPFPSGSRALGNFSHAFSITPFLFQ